MCQHPECRAHHPPTMADAAEMLWVVLANVSGGDWMQQTPEWREAAARWRDNYFAALKAAAAPPAGARIATLLALAQNWLDHATAKQPGWGNQPAVPIALVDQLAKEVAGLTTRLATLEQERDKQ